MRTQSANALFELFKGCGDVHAALTRRAESILPSDLTMPQFNILDDLRKNALLDNALFLTPLELAKSQNITKGAVTNLLNQLYKKQMIMLEKHPKDGRSKLISLSDKGARAHRHSMVALSQLTSEILLQFSSDELSTALPILSKFTLWLDVNET